MNELIHGDDDPCTTALAKVHDFLHNELPASDADLIRAHLDACEKCFADFDIEQTITAMLRRCVQPSSPAPLGLRMRISSMHVIRYYEGPA